MKKSLIVLLCIISVFSASSVFAKKSASKSRWVQVGDKWKYELQSGSGNFVQDKWRGIFDKDGITQKVYYFDYDGFMATGPIVIKEELYVYGEDGAAVTTGFDVNGVHYQTAENGKVIGLPANTDLSMFKRAKTINDNILINAGIATQYDDNNSITPTAPANSQ